MNTMLIKNKGLFFCLRMETTQLLLADAGSRQRPNGVGTRWLLRLKSRDMTRYVPSSYTY
jgi:hypothetical protein